MTSIINTIIFSFFMLSACGKKIVEKSESASIHNFKFDDQVYSDLGISTDTISPDTTSIRFKGSIDSVGLVIVNVKSYEIELQKTYLEAEKILREDFNISDTAMIDNMQLMIDEGALVYPHIVNPKTYKITYMTYKEYLEFRQKNPLK